MKTKAQEIGVRVGAAIARDVLADSDLGREWTGIEDQDGDQFTASGIEPGTPEWAEAEQAAEAEYRRRIEEAALVCGLRVQIDRSGQGHAWRDIDAAIPAQIRQEIEGEIVGGREECDDYLASNGMHYRW